MRRIAFRDRFQRVPRVLIMTLSLYVKDNFQQLLMSNIFSGNFVSGPMRGKLFQPYPIYIQVFLWKEPGSAPLWLLVLGKLFLPSLLVLSHHFVCGNHPTMAWHQSLWPIVFEPVLVSECNKCTHDVIFNIHLWAYLMNVILETWFTPGTSYS